MDNEEPKPITYRAINWDSPQLTKAEQLIQPKRPAGKGKKQEQRPKLELWHGTDDKTSRAIANTSLAYFAIMTYKNNHQ